MDKQTIRSASDGWSVLVGAEEETVECGTKHKQKTPTNLVVYRSLGQIGTPAYPGLDNLDGEWLALGDALTGAFWS